MSELKIVITGCVGSGKTTAIQAISDIPVIATEVDASDEVANMKDTTTVAMDYGELALGPDSTVKIYGTPGQLRFGYMWEILAEGALGIIILVNHGRENPIDDLSMYLDNFRQHIKDSTAVIGITHCDDPLADMSRYHDFLGVRGLDFPVFPVDARDPAQVRLLIEAMAAMVTLDEEETHELH